VRTLGLIGFGMMIASFLTVVGVCAVMVGHRRHRS